MALWNKFCIILQRLGGNYEKKCSRNTTENNVVLINVEFRAPGIIHLILMASAIVQPTLRWEGWK